MKLLILGLLFSLNSFATAKPMEDKIVKVKMVTSVGDIEISLNETKAPITVKNFLSYVDKKFYSNTIFHRVIKGFMIQGGGFEKTMTKKTSASPIVNEANNGLNNEVGTIAMARMSDPNSASSQFFINVNNNSSLDYAGPASFGYAVFGRVTKGMTVVNKIKMTPTTRKGSYSDVPREPIIIKSVSRL
jgi:cyclophilin family peptidyl-prolyl cis-trans isomerase